MSVGGPEYSLRCTISGAMYEGVPQNILSLVSGCELQQKPKSISLMIS